MMRAADAAAQLVQLREAEPVGAVDDDRVGARDVDAGFDDRRAHQHVEALPVEIEHHLFELALGHLAVRDAQARFGDELAAARARCVSIVSTSLCRKYTWPPRASSRWNASRISAGS